MTAEIEKELNKDDKAKEFAGVAKAAFGQVLNIAEGFLKDSTAASLSLHFNDKGLSMTALAELQALQLRREDGRQGEELRRADARRAAQPQVLRGCRPRQRAAGLGPVGRRPARPHQQGTGRHGSRQELCQLDRLDQERPARRRAWRLAIRCRPVVLGADSIIQSVAVVKGD